LLLQTISAFRKRFSHVAIGQGYGMTESSTIISTMDASHDFPGASAGYLLPNVECVVPPLRSWSRCRWLRTDSLLAYRAKIVSPEGKALPPKQVGELLARMPSIALGCASFSPSLPPSTHSVADAVLPRRPQQRQGDQGDV